MANSLTSIELKTLHNTKFFTIKESSTKKIQHLLAEVRDEIKSSIKQEKISFPKEVDAQTGKIFRGENYLGLPYLVLDYPKHFSKESVFAFRTMFWWGNFFSFTLHLQGKALSENRNTLIRNITSLKKKNICFCVNSSPWQYHYKQDNYLPIDKLSEQELRSLFSSKEFIKLSRKIPLKDYKKIVKFSRESFSIFSLLLNNP